MAIGYKGENMAKVTFEVERCKGCGLCETVCPKQIIALSKEKIKGYVDLGYMRRSGDRISLTEDGFYVSNTILAELL